VGVLILGIGRSVVSLRMLVGSPQAVCAQPRIVVGTEDGAPLTSSGRDAIFEVR